MLKDYIDYCKSKQDCDTCELSRTAIDGLYECCLGFIAEHPEKAEEIIAAWKEEEKQRQIANRQFIYVISNEYDTCIYAIASTKEKAEKIVEKLAMNALADCLAVDPEDSGIYWDSWDEERRKSFYETEIKSGYCITETRLDTYKIDEEVECI